MQTLSSVTIDTSILAIPDSDSTEEDTHQYVEKLIDCGGLLNESWVQVYMSDNSIASFIALGHFPQWEKLRHLFRVHRVVEYDVNTVTKHVNDLMKRALSFEESFRITDVLQENFETTPDISTLTRHDDLQADLKRCITLIAHLCKYCSLSCGRHSFFVSKAPCRKIFVRTEIQVLDHKREEIPDLSDESQTFEGDVEICDNFEEFITCLDESAILKGATDDAALKLAVQVKLFKYAKENGESVDWDRICVPVIGSTFRESCQTICNAQKGSLPEKILQSVIATVYKLKLDDVHVLRIGSGGGDPPKTRGSDIAQRRKIDHFYRLHYWAMVGGAIELASVNVHDDNNIPK